MSDVRARLAAALTGRYTIERELGRGGMAIVYLAHDLRLSRRVALKILRPELAATLGPERFLREIKVVAGLAHPHILPLHDSGEAAGMLYYVMPYVEGESLRHRLVREGALPLEDALEVAREVADALDYAHQHDVVHRDIKPENILLQAGQAVVSDFGIARAISEAQGRVTGTGIAVGTPEYMSPEQAAGKNVDGRTDVYSLGCVLYEMLVGRLPFAQGGGGDAADAPTFSAIRPAIPVEVAAAVEVAIAQRPDERFPRAADFARALREPGMATVSGARRTRRRRGWAVVTGAVVIMTSIGAWLLSGRPRTAAPASGASAELASATSAPSAFAHLVQAQERFWSSDLDGAAAALRRAIAADSDFAVAYHRLSVVETWRWDYPAARASVEAGLRRAPHFSPRWRQLLEAQRHFVMRSADSAIAAFQIVATDYPDLIDGQLGLAEALYHYGGMTGAAPLDAQWPFERVVHLDSAFAPIYHHLLALAIYRGDESRARAMLAHIRLGDRERPWTEAIVPLRFGDPATRARTLEHLRQVERRVISLLVAHLGHAATDLPLVDTLGGLLLDPARPPADRQRGAQYRLVALAAQGRWEDGIAAWRPVGGRAGFDRWVVQAYLAGYQATALARPMFAWAQARVAEGQAPDFTRLPSEDAQQGFQALVHRATLEGDSTAVRRLLDLLARAAPRADPSDPLPAALRASLLSRLALLRSDTVEAMRLLGRAASRAAEPLGTFYPLLTMAPQRLLLAELSLRRGDPREARLWLDSFGTVWSFGDVLYVRRVACLSEAASSAASGAAVARRCAS